MNPKLIALNLVLASVVIYGGVQLNNQHQAAKARAAALRAVHIPPTPAPQFNPLANDPPVLPSGYQDVAIKDLFHPSRNPEIVKELPPPPPPPPPMPTLPRFHGQMSFGDGPIVILAEKSGMPEKSLKIGDTIGQFKLADVSTNDITFEWSFNGDRVRRSLRELADEPATSSSGSGQDSRAAAIANAGATPPPPPPAVKSAIGPGELTGLGTKICDPNDSTPAGTVVNGFRKTEGRTPFGSFCVWDPVK